MEEVQSETPVRTPMTHDCSECINEISAALAKAQGAIVAAEKGELNPHFKRRYADLADVWAACRKPLSDNGLAVLQIPSIDQTFVVVRTILSHSSGQFFASTMAATAQLQSPQQIGSVVTYLRRYALSAMVGVAPKGDDDDGGGDTGDKEPPPQNDRRELVQPRQDPAPRRERTAPTSAPKAAPAPDPAAVAMGQQFALWITERGSLDAQRDLRIEIRKAKVPNKEALLEASYTRSIALTSTAEERKPLAVELQRDEFSKDVQQRLNAEWRNKKSPAPEAPNG